MANTYRSQLLVDGPRNVVVLASGILDTSDLASTVLLDPAVLVGTDNTGLIKAANLSLLKVVFTVEDALEVRLAWDATTPVVFDILTGRTKTDYHDISGLPPPKPALAGATGKVLISTEGWSAGKILSFTVTAYFKKLGT